MSGTVPSMKTKNSVIIIVTIYCLCVRHLAALSLKF